MQKVAEYLLKPAYKGYNPDNLARFIDILLIQGYRMRHARGIGGWLIFQNRCDQQIAISNDVHVGVGGAYRERTTAFLEHLGIWRAPRNRRSVK
jgi:hypothetical protein